jgi:hypothetical protein
MSKLNAENFPERARWRLMEVGQSMQLLLKAELRVFDWGKKRCVRSNTHQGPLR